MDETTMNHCRPILLAAFSACFCAAAQAQTYKCLDAAGKVTYSSTTCDLLGMRDAGEVRDRLNTAPAQKVPPRPAPPPASAPATAKTPAAAAEAKAPERRCFKTAKGYRCNDDPGVPDPAPPSDARTKAERKAE
jgi:hypothetical protein